MTPKDEINPLFRGALPKGVRSASAMHLNKKEATAMTQKHTPGPWNDNEKADGTGRRVIHDPVGRLIAVVPHAGDAAYIVSCVNALGGINPEAVPELLKAAKEAQDYLHECTYSAWATRVMNMLTAAIAKAGEGN